MTNRQIKTISIRDYLNNRESIRKAIFRLWDYKNCSGWGPSSLKSNTNRNLWYDFGSTRVEALLDLVMNWTDARSLKAMSNWTTFHPFPGRRRTIFFLHRNPNKLKSGSIVVEEKPLEAFPDCWNIVGKPEDRFRYRTGTLQWSPLPNRRKKLLCHRFRQWCRRVWITQPVL